MVVPIGPTSVLFAQVTVKNVLDVLYNEVDGDRVVNPSRDDHISVFLGLKDTEGSLEAVSSGVTSKYSGAG